LRRRVQLDPASIAFAALAEEYRRAGRYDEAIATCTAGLQRHPSYLSAHVTLGRALLEVGQYDEAREELEHVLRIAPENLAAIRGLAEIHHRRGELPESHDDYVAPAPAEEHPELEPEPEPDSVPAPATAAAPEPPAWEYGVIDSAPASALPPAREANSALEGLESLLAAITRARESAAPRG
jgi:tetratricopeptide (TPR) repeat protein